MWDLFHRWVRQTEPLLHEVNAQHGRHRHGWVSCLARHRMRLNQLDQLDQFGPRHHQGHLAEKIALARLLGHKFKSTSDRTSQFHKYQTSSQVTRLTYAEIN